MGNITTSVNGQSNFDICLGNTYGTLDNFIKLLSDNSISNSSQVIKSYQFDSTLKNINTNNLGKRYATNNINQNDSDSSDGRVYSDAYGDAYG